MPGKARRSTHDPATTQPDDVKNAGLVCIAWTTYEVHAEALDLMRANLISGRAEKFQRLLFTFSERVTHFLKEEPEKKERIYLTDWERDTSGLNPLSTVDSRQSLLNSEPASGPEPFPVEQSLATISTP